MSNHWLRLWHDMPNDPKWRTVARISGQPISLVQATYIHLLVDASRNVTRGHAEVTIEDLASALDVTEESISSILEAMQGRVLEGMALSGWNVRQPKREDVGSSESGAKSAAQRKREQREREKEAEKPEAKSRGHGTSRKVTLDKEEDKDKEEIKENKPPAAQVSSLSVSDLASLGVENQTAVEFLAIRKRKRAPLTQLAMEGIQREAANAGWTINAVLKKCIERGWQSFEAGWVGGNLRGGVIPINKQEALEARNRQVAERFARGA